MTPKRCTFLLAPALVFGLGITLGTVACGGGHASATAPAPAPVAAATGLAYTDPTGTGWRLLKDAASTPTRLLLNLVGPTGLGSRGAGFNLPLPAGLRAGVFADTDMPIRDLGVYELLNITQSNSPKGPLEPKLMLGGVKQGNLLTVAEFQKDRQLAAPDSGAPLFQIALEFDPAAHRSVGDTLPLTIVKSKYMAEDIGAYYPSPTAEITAKAHLFDMTIAVGTLTAK